MSPKRDGFKAYNDLGSNGEPCSSQESMDVCIRSLGNVADIFLHLHFPPYVTQ